MQIDGSIESAHGYSVRSRGRNVTTDPRITFEIRSNQ